MALSLWLIFSLYLALALYFIFALTRFQGASHTLWPRILSLFVPLGSFAAPEVWRARAEVNLVSSPLGLLPSWANCSVKNILFTLPLRSSWRGRCLHSWPYLRCLSDAPGIQLVDSVWLDSIHIIKAKWLTIERVISFKETTRETNNWN